MLEGLNQRKTPETQQIPVHQARTVMQPVCLTCIRQKSRDGPCPTDGRRASCGGKVGGQSLDSGIRRNNQIRKEFIDQRMNRMKETALGSGDRADIRLRVAFIGSCGIDTSL